MNRLLIVTPNEQIYKSATEVISEAFIDAKVIKASSNDVVEKVRSPLCRTYGRSRGPR